MGKRRKEAETKSERAMRLAFEARRLAVKNLVPKLQKYLTNRVLLPEAREKAEACIAWAEKFLSDDARRHKLT